MSGNGETLQMACAFSNLLGVMSGCNALVLIYIMLFGSLVLVPKCPAACWKDALIDFPQKAEWNIIDHETCALCHSSPETRNHLFFDCPYSKYLWKLCRLKLNISEPMGDLIHEPEQFKNPIKRKHRTYILSRLALNVTVWHMWRERNRRVFLQQKLHIIIVYRRIYEDINVLMRTYHWKVSSSSSTLSYWSISNTDTWL